MTVAHRPTVSFVTRILTHYRIPFHERVRTLLAAQGIEYRLIYGQPDAQEAAKGDLATVPWGTPVRNRPLFGRGKLVWQPIARTVRSSGLVVLGQENQLLVNYPLQLLPRGLRPRLALWGHGRNFQARDPNSTAERWKRFWATRCDWWFAYTDESRRHVESLGFPADRITVFNNAVDTAALARTAAELTPADIAQARAGLGVTGNRVGIFVGGLYPDKRLSFLVAAADRVRAAVPDFQLVVVGAGEDAGLLAELATTRAWLHLAGAHFGRDKAALMAGADLFLMPGLVGLAVLDAGIMGLPVVTTAYPWHSPEIAYLRDGETGVVVSDWQSEAAYADAVVGLMNDDTRRTAMATAAHTAAGGFTIDAMAQRFAEGVVAALARR